MDHLRDSQVLVLDSSLFPDKRQMTPCFFSLVTVFLWC